MRAILVALVRGYRALVSPALPPACRFVPSCSAYAEEAILRRGAIAGSALAFRRLLRCHPWGGSGYDPVDPPSPSGSDDDQAVQGAARPSCNHFAPHRAPWEP